MGYGGNLWLIFFADRVDHEHIICRFGNGLVTVKIFQSIIFTHHRSKRTEFFPMLDFKVKDILHFWIAGVGENAACPQCSWAPFHSSLEPTNDMITMD